MDEFRYYEVEGAVMREVSGKPMEVYKGADKWVPYTGDVFRVHRASNEHTLDEVRPYMDVEKPAK